ncbi:hypothetical protein CAEBREN_25046 [Caenorhabditis brenneri]|uniref:F-box domain-containing protein n=1 Tax=Caenorhabditis brenneri TaxID=135651 RepID=G0N674_CAEBE|nr:hypothetical protein CAEBREN_25046 [Caenorhabditis brenneri]
MVHHTVYPFNFFAKLPDLARQNLTRQMEIQDLILLSACSKRCALAIRISRVPPVTINIDIRSYQMEISMPSEDFTWRFESGEFEPEDIFKIKDIPVEISGDGELETVLENNLDAAFNTAISQILYIIPSCEFKQLYLNVAQNFPLDFRCSVALAGVSQVKEISLYGHEDPSENIKYVLENIHATEEIVDRFQHKDTEIIDKKLILTTPNVCFRNSEFLKPFNHFPSTSTQEAYFNDVVFDEKVLIQFLKWFKSAPASELRNFKGIKWVNRNSGFEVPDLTEFGAKEGDLKLRAKYYPCGHILCCAGNPITIGSGRCRSHVIVTTDGLDILRDDGLLGTILRHHFLSIAFVVWHERFPEQPE